MADFAPPWADGGTRRAPTTQEQAAGFVCGPADPALFNFLFHRIQSEIDSVITGAGLTPSDASLNQLLLGVTAIATDIASGYTRIITANTTLTVIPADPASATNFLTLQAALDSLDNAMIAAAATVTINVAAGVHTITSSIRIRHAHGSRIRILGAALPGSFPVYTDVTSNVATSRTALRAKFSTIFDIQAVTGMIVEVGGLGLIQDIMLDHNSGGTGTQSCIVSQSGLVYAYRVMAFGCNLSGASDLGAGFAADISGTIQTSQCAAAHCDEGILALHGGYVSLTGTSTPQAFVIQCPVGLAARRRGIIRGQGLTIRDASAFGARIRSSGLIVLDGAVSGFTGNEVNVNADGGRIEMIAPSLGAVTGAQSMLATAGGYIDASSPTGTVTASPTVNTVGNNNSYIYSH